MIDDIFRKAPADFKVYHGLCAAYYECLMQLDDLTPVHKMGDAVGQKAASAWQEMLVGKPMPVYSFSMLQA